MVDANESTFGNIEMEERFKKLERSLKLSLLRQNRSKVAHSQPTSPSVSSIYSDFMNNSHTTSVSRVLPASGSEVLAFSNNLKNIFPRRTIHNSNNEIQATSSIKDYNVKQEHIDRHIMPPPMTSNIYHNSKRIVSKAQTLSESTSFNRPIQSPIINQCPLEDSATNVPINTYSNKEYLHSPVASITSINKLQRATRTFSNWKVKLNDHYQLIIKGTLECGRVARSKPIVKRYNATCVKSSYKYIYYLQGNIVDERKELPDYVRGKFYNGFPDDWENVLQIWRTFVIRGCSVMFRWPTSIADSDDDIKSEITDSTYMGTTTRKTNMIESCKTNESSRQLSKFKNSCNPELSKIAEKHRNNTHSVQNYEENNTPSRFICEKDFPVAQAETTNNKENNHDVQTVVKISYILTKKLEDILQKDKLDIIIKNLMDQKNCSPKYIDKIVEMINCLDYVMSYRTDSEISMSCETTKSEIIPLRSIDIDTNSTNTGKFESATLPEIHVHSTDLGYGSIKNDTNYVHPNARNSVELICENHKDLDKSESEIYAGIPRIPFERILRAKEPLKKIFQRKMKKKQTQSEDATDPSNNANMKFCISNATSVINVKRNPPSDESCLTDTEDEVEVLNAQNNYGTVNIAPKLENLSLSTRIAGKFNKFNTYKGENIDLSDIQNECYLEKRETNKSNFIKELDIPFNVRENAHSQCKDIDIDDTVNFDIKKQAVTNTQGASKAAQEVESCIIPNRNAVTVANGSDTFAEKSHVSQNLRKGLIEQPKSEAATERSKPVVVSSVRCNLKVKLNKVNLQKSVQSHESDVSIIEHEMEHPANVRSTVEVDKKRVIPKSPVSAKSAIATHDSHSKKIIDKKEAYVADKHEIETTSSANTIKSTSNIMEQFKKKLPEDNPKMLTAWMPQVVKCPNSEIELGLTFQGKLLNEVGHVINRKFTTDYVLRRLSPTLIETVTHEFYQLLGCINDHKHVIPKELVKQCNNGCPAKIEQFCLTWKSLQSDKKLESVELTSQNDTTIDLLCVPVSSRGRKIVPPLSYWTGERVILKDNIPVYSPGNTLESSLKSSLESPGKNIGEKIDSKCTSNKKNANERKSLKTNETSDTNKNQTIVIEKSRSKVSNKLTMTEVKNNARSYNISGSPKVVIKRSTVQQLTFSSTDSSENEREERQMSLRKNVRKSQATVNNDTRAQSKYVMKLRKRPKMEELSNRISREDASKYKYNTAHSSPTNKSNEYNVAYTCYKGIPREDLLSENQISPA